MTSETGDRILYLPIGAVESDEANLLDYWRAIASRKGSILLLTLLITAISGFFIMIMEPKYVAHADVLYAQDGTSPKSSSEGGSTGGEDATGGRESTGAVTVPGSKEEATAILNSRRFTTRFIEDEKLLPILFYDRWDSATNDWRKDEDIKPPTLWEAYKLFDEKIREVTEDRTTGLTSVSIEWRDANQASAWSNLLVARLNDHLKKRAIEQARKSLAYLHDELKGTTVADLQQSLYGMIEEQMKLIMVANVSDEYAFRVIDPAVPPETEFWTLIKRIALIVFIGMTSLVLGAFMALFLAYLERLQMREPGRGETIP